MSDGDYRPVGLAYSEKWQQEDIHPDELNDEISALVRTVCSEYIEDASGLQTPVLDFDRAEACKRLCALARHEKSREQFKRQQTIASQKLISELVLQITEASELIQYWAGLLIVQLVLHNVVVSVLALKCGLVAAITDTLALAEIQRTQQDRRGAQGGLNRGKNAQGPTGKHRTAEERRKLGLEPEIVPERTQLVCMQILNNVVVPYPESISTMLATDVQGRGIVYACSCIVRRGRKLEVPLFIQAVQLLKAFSLKEEARIIMLRADVCVNLRQHHHMDTTEGKLSAEIRETLMQFAACKLQKNVRGHQSRIIFEGYAEKERVLHLQGFVTRMALKWGFKGYKKAVKNAVAIKDFMSRWMGKKTADPMQLGFDALAIYREMLAQQRTAAEDLRVKCAWSQRDLMFDLWADHLEMEVVDLNEQVAKKCGRVLRMITGEVFNRCWLEWKGLVRKAKAVKRRWLHGALDSGWRAWRILMEQKNELHALVEDKCMHVKALIAGDFLRVSLTEWRMIIVKKRRAMQRFMNATLNFGWVNWVAHVEDERELRGKVLSKCSKVLSLLAADGVKMSFGHWRTFVVLRQASVRVREGFRIKSMGRAWAAWDEVLGAIQELMAQVRQTCSRVVAYIAGGYLLECWKEWKLFTDKLRRARWKWRNSSLVGVWKAWINDFIPYARLLKSIKKRFEERFQRAEFHLWITIIDERKHNRIMLKEFLRLFTNIRIIRPFRTMRAYADQCIRYRSIVTRFKRRFDLRAVRGFTLGWADWAFETAERNRRLRILTARIDSRIPLLFIETLAKTLENKLHALKAALIDKSDLIKRWTLRPMITTFELWDGHVIEEKRKREVIARLRYRMQNRCVVVTVDSWKTYVRLSRDERHELLAHGVREAVQHGRLEEVQNAVAWHTASKKRYWLEDGKRIIQDALNAELAWEAQKAETKAKRGGTRRLKAISGSSSAIAEGVAFLHSSFKHQIQVPKVKPQPTASLHGLGPGDQRRAEALRPNISTSNGVLGSETNAKSSSKAQGNLEECQLESESDASFTRDELDFVLLQLEHVDSKRRALALRNITDIVNTWPDLSELSLPSLPVADYRTSPHAPSHAVMVERKEGPALLRDEEQREMLMEAFLDIEKRCLEAADDADEEVRKEARRLMRALKRCREGRQHQDEGLASGEAAFDSDFFWDRMLQPKEILSPTRDVLVSRSNSAPTTRSPSILHTPREHPRDPASPPRAPLTEAIAGSPQASVDGHSPGGRASNASPVASAADKRTPTASPIASVTERMTPAASPVASVAGRCERVGGSSQRWKGSAPAEVGTQAPEIEAAVASEEGVGGKGSAASGIDGRGANGIGRGSSKRVAGQARMHEKDLSVSDDVEQQHSIKVARLGASSPNLEAELGPPGSFKSRKLKLPEMAPASDPGPGSSDVGVQVNGDDLRSSRSSMSDLRSETERNEMFRVEFRASMSRLEGLKPYSVSSSEAKDYGNSRATIFHGKQRAWKAEGSRAEHGSSSDGGQRGRPSSLYHERGFVGGWGAYKEETEDRRRRKLRSSGLSAVLGKGGSGEGMKRTAWGWVPDYDISHAAVQRTATWEGVESNLSSFEQAFAARRTSSNPHGKSGQKAVHQRGERARKLGSSSVPLPLI